MCLHEIWRVWKIHLSLFLVSLTPSALCYFIGGARFYGLWPQGHMGGRQSFLVAHNLVLSVLGIHERKELKITKVYLSLSSYDLRVASQKGNFYLNFLYCCVVWSLVNNGLETADMVCGLNIVITYGYFWVLRKPEVDEMIGFHIQRQCYFHQ